MSTRSGSACPPRCLRDWDFEVTFFKQSQQGEQHVWIGTRARLRLRGRGLRRVVHFVDSEAARGQCSNAGDRGRDTTRRASVFESPVSDDCDRRRRARGHHRDRAAAGHLDRDRLRPRCRAVRRSGLRRHERVGARECAHRAGCDTRVESGVERGVPWRRDHRPAGGGTWADRRRRLLLGAALDACGSQCP